MNCNVWVGISFVYFIIGCLIGYYYGKREIKKDLISKEQNE